MLTGDELRRRKQELKEECHFLVQLPRKLRADFKEACKRRGITAKSAIMLFMWATIHGEVYFDKKMRLRKKLKRAK